MSPMRLKVSLSTITATRRGGRGNEEGNKRIHEEGADSDRGCDTARRARPRRVFTVRRRLSCCSREPRARTRQDLRGSRTEVPEEYPREDHRGDEGTPDQYTREQEARAQHPCPGSGGPRARPRRCQEGVREGPPRRRRPREGHGLPVAGRGQRLHRGPEGRLPGDEEQPGV